MNARPAPTTTDTRVQSLHKQQRPPPRRPASMGPIWTRLMVPCEQYCKKSKDIERQEAVCNSKSTQCKQSTLSVSMRGQRLDGVDFREGNHKQIPGYGREDVASSSPKPWPRNVCVTLVHFCSNDDMTTTTTLRRNGLLACFHPAPQGNLVCNRPPSPDPCCCVVVSLVTVVTYWQVSSGGHMHHVLSLFPPELRGDQNTGL